MNHTPVLLHEVIELLSPRPGEFFIDGTVDGGGHTREIAQRISPGGTLLGVDWDPDMIARIKEKFSAPGVHVRFVHGNYADLTEILKSNRLPKAHGVLLDLGFSSTQLTTSERGFSFESDEPLRMTYDPSEIPVSELLKKMTEREIKEIISTLGGERFSGRIARVIRETISRKPIRTAKELSDLIVRAVPRGYERGRIHPATRTFQALRIYANRELENLAKFLELLPRIVRTGGRAAIISFHSLEDRIVKTHFRDLAKQGHAQLLTKKPITPTDDECKKNPRSRSAKLRAVVMR